MTPPNLSSGSPTWRYFGHKNRHLLDSAILAAVQRIRREDYVEGQFRALVVLGLKRRWRSNGPRYAPVCDTRFLYPLPVPDGLRAFLDDFGTIFVLGQPQYRGNPVSEVSEPYRHTYVPYDHQTNQSLTPHLISAINQVAR